MLKYEISMESMPDNIQLNVQCYPNVKPSVYLCLFTCAVRAGNVRNIIQQFENHTETGEEGSDAADAQRLSSNSLGDDSMDR